MGRARLGFAACPISEPLRIAFAPQPCPQHPPPLFAGVSGFADGWAAAPDWRSVSFAACVEPLQQHPDFTSLALFIDWVNLSSSMGASDFKVHPVDARR